MEKHLFWYKYHSVNRYLFDLLVNQEFWFSKPKDFNDPFDTSQSNFQEYKEWLVKSMKEDYEEKIGVCCFSLDPKSILMWSHYSDNHKGVCLKFDRLKDMECFRGSYPVDYLLKSISYYKYK